VLAGNRSQMCSDATLASPARLTGADTLTAAIRNIVVPVTMTEADRRAIADLVIAGIPKPPTAAEIADELARRLAS
jgi:hypothetical protein